MIIPVLELFLRVSLFDLSDTIDLRGLFSLEVENAMFVNCMRLHFSSLNFEVPQQ